MDEIAKLVNMAPSSFYRNFKKVTQTSPLQYQKQLRLNEAQRLMLTANTMQSPQAILWAMKARRNLAESIKKCSEIRQKQM